MSTSQDRSCGGAPGGNAAGSRRTGPIHTLKRRPDFLATRKGSRWATRLFVMEALRRPLEAAASPGPAPCTGPRFGFTVSKQVGHAVERNRIKRRLKAAVRETQATHARADYDYVLVARRPALDADYSALISDLVTAYGRVHAGRRPSHGRGGKQG